MSSADLRWANYPKHMPFYSRANEWPQIVRETGEKRGVARYIHTLTPNDIQRIEAKCIDKGERVHASLEVYCYDAGFVVGASCGEETRWLRVVVSSGVYHGRPVTEAQVQNEMKRRTRR